MSKKRKDSKKEKILKICLMGASLSLALCLGSTMAKIAPMPGPLDLYHQTFWVPHVMPLA